MRFFAWSSSVAPQDSGVDTSFDSNQGTGDTSILNVRRLQEITAHDFELTRSFGTPADADITSRIGADVLIGDCADVAVRHVQIDVPGQFEGGLDG